ncbi:hypothetical protein OAV81_02695 [Candidatus Thioglobus sp.]|nr:hypothetical protein [Candidatus Thioglobus sp.]
MKKLLSLLLLSFSFMGLANAESEWSYYCEVGDSIIYNHSERTLIEPKPTNLFFHIDKYRTKFGLWDSPFNITDTSEFIINDYEDYQNFNATLANEKDIYSNLTYHNGSLALTWLYKDSASIGVYFANCTEEHMFALYEPEVPVMISRCGDIAVDVTESDSYSGGIEIPIYINLAPDDPICIKAKNHVFEALGGWRHNDRILPYESFATEWLSGDNFDEFNKAEWGDDFRESPGKYFGKEIPSLEGKVSSWDSNVMVYISVPLDTLDYDKENESTGQDYLRHLHTEKIRLKNYGVHFKTSEPYPLETYYTKIGEIDLDTCSKLAPNIKGTCAESHIVYLQKYGGGSMGPTTSIGIFGLFQLDNGKEYMVPLKYLAEKAAMKYTGL